MTNPVLTFSVSDDVRVDNSGAFTLTQTPVSEPASLALLGAGVLGLGLIHRRQKA